MDHERLNALEVKPWYSEPAWYRVTVYQYVRGEKDAEYFKEWFYFNGEKWEYGEFEGTVYVCFIHAKEDDRQ